MVTGLTMGHALGIPVHGICSLDVIARQAGVREGGYLLVATDARRREVYWAHYRVGVTVTRVAGPSVDRPADILISADARLLGDPADLVGRRVLEVGCGSAPCSRWLAAQGAEPVGLDLSGGMLRHAAAAGVASGVVVPLVQAGAERLPFADDAFDLACSAFGAVPFVAEPERVMREVARVLRPGGRWVFAVNHPMRWPLPDSPDPDDLTVVSSYFDRRPYVETDDAGRTVYVEHHRTVGDWVRAVVGAGLTLTDLLEPEWTPGRTRTWGQWSPARGALVPGTLILVCDVST